MKFRFIWFMGNATREVMNKTAIILSPFHKMIQL